MTVDDLEAYGTERMDDEEITQLLSNQDTGVLALPTEGAPSMRPLSFYFDGESAIYFVYIIGAGSRKAELSETADVARLLVYTTDTASNWRSVLLTGTINRVTESETNRLETALETGRPDALKRAMESERTELYRFDIEDRSGIKHLGLPPGFDSDESGTA